MYTYVCIYSAHALTVRAPKRSISPASVHDVVLFLVAFRRLLHVSRTLVNSDLFLLPHFQRLFQASFLWGGRISRWGSLCTPLHPLAAMDGLLLNTGGMEGRGEEWGYL